MGATENGTTTGVFIGDGPRAVKDILKRSGLTAELTESTFNTASEVAPQIISLAIPESVEERKSAPIRDIINKVNESIFGSLYQSKDFKLEYQVLDPARTTSYERFIEADVLKLSIKSDTSRIAKDVIVEYLVKEYDAGSGEGSVSEKSFSSEIAEYLAKVSTQFRVTTVLQDEADANVFAQRWAFIREIVSSVMEIGTSLKGARLQIHDRVKLVHEKLYERFGNISDRVKLAGVSGIQRDFASSSVELDDVGNSFNRTSTITENTANPWSSATVEDKQLNGYITDNNGMISNDPDTFGICLIW
jgi:hypothetical protein